MKKVSIIYWSQGGNIEVLANLIAKGARDEGAEVNIKHVADADLEDVINADVVAFGSPASDSTKIEQNEMQPFIDKLSTLENKNKNCVLFATYGWIEDKFMAIWEKQMLDNGFNIVGELSVKESPNKEQMRKAEELGKLLTKDN